MISNRFSYTFYFKEIFPDLDTFQTAMENQNLSVDLTVPENENFLAYLYNLLYRKYANSSIAFDTPDEFTRQLAGRLDDYFQKFLRDTQLAQKVYKLTDDEIIQASEAISNMANNPDTAPTDPRQPLEFVSGQTFSLVKSNKLIAYMTALNSMPTLRQGEILKHFAPLFRALFTSEYFFFHNESEG